MYRPLKFATLIAVALAFTACADSARNPITEPNGLSLAKGTVTPLSSSMLALHAEIVDKTDDLYCTANTLQRNVLKDADKLRIYAEFGWWTAEDGAEDGAAPHENVAYIAAKMIANNESNLAAGKTCGDAALVAELTVLINTFANQGEFDGGEGGASFTCPAGQTCDEQRTGPNGFGFTAPNGSFGNEDVVIVILPYSTPPANAVGNAWRFDVYGFSGTQAGPWTRWICWNGFVGEEEVDPNPDYVVMVRQEDGGTLDYLETQWEGTRCVEPVASLNPILRGAYKLFAGLPFLPSEATAYSPPRTFGGTSTAASPHWLTVVEPVEPPPNFTLQDLYALTQQYYGTASPNQTAALGKLQDAIDCTTNEQLTEAQVTECVNTALQQYINNVRAQTGKQGVTAAEGEELMGLALSLMQ